MAQTGLLAPSRENREVGPVATAAINRDRSTLSEVYKNSQDVFEVCLGCLGRFIYDGGIVPINFCNHVNRVEITHFINRPDTYQSG